MLARSPLLAPLASAVARHHERVDGSGYPAAAAVLAGLPLDREAIRAVLDAAGARGLPCRSSPPTYAKCGVSTRAALAMFAMQHGLVGAKID